MVLLNGALGYATQGTLVHHFVPYTCLYFRDLHYLYSYFHTLVQFYILYTFHIFLNVTCNLNSFEIS
jgi:hypothetical protein